MAIIAIAYLWLALSLPAAVITNLWKFTNSAPIQGQVRFFEVPSMSKDTVDVVVLSKKRMSNPMLAQAIWRQLIQPGGQTGGTPANTPPEITPPGAQTIDEEASLAAQNFTISDGQTAAASLTVSATSGNQNLVQNGSITLGGSGATRTVAIVPVPEANGVVVITLNVTDGQVQSSADFTLTINAINDAPNITQVGSQSTPLSTPHDVNVQIFDQETALADLTMSGASDNQTLLPNANITFAGTDGNRTATLTPAAGQSGSANVTLATFDGSLSGQTIFLFTVDAAPNTAPTISDITNQTINENANTGALAFTVGDAQTAAGSLTVSGMSSDQTLVPNATSFSFGGSGASRTVTVTPAANKFGTATTTISVSDGVFSTSDTFTLTVTSVNSTPTISDTPNQSTPVNTPKAVNFTVSDVETAAGSLTVTGASSNDTLVPDANVVITGSTGNRTATITPAAGQSGTTTITLTASDGSASAQDTFVLTVTAAPNTPPTVGPPGNQVIAENGTGGPWTFTVQDAETPASQLIVSTNCSNTTLIPLANITTSGTGTSRTISVTPAANQFGSATITITVQDSGGLISSGVFTVTVTSDNSAPTIGAISGYSISEDSLAPTTYTIAATDYFISPTGNDSNAGTVASPVLTLEGARTKVRALGGSLPVGGVNVWLRAGVYLRAASFDLTGSQDSGTPTRPVMYRAYPGEAVQIIGGKEVTGWAAVGVHARLNTTQEANILTADLAALGIATGSMVPYGMLNSISDVLQTEISFRGRTMRLARYPNFNQTYDASQFATFEAPVSSTTFTYVGTRPSTGNGTAWAEPVANILVGGWWQNGFNFSARLLTTLNTSTRLATMTAQPAYAPTVGVNNREQFIWFNVLEELDEAGEYYIDRSANRIYFWPTATITGTSSNRVFASQLTTQIISATSVSNVVFEGLTIEGTRYRGVTLTGCNNVDLINCHLRNSAAEMVVMNPLTSNSEIINCDLYDIQGISLDGGTRSTLTPGNNAIRNSRLHNFQQRGGRNYFGIALHGVGQVVSSNLIHSSPGCAIYGQGNDHVIQYNEIHHVNTETDDFGAIYFGRNPTEQGTIVRYNYFHDIDAVDGAYANPNVSANFGVYWDDNGSGFLVHGNIFDNMQAPILNKGGRDNIFTNNICARLTKANWQFGYFVQSNMSAESLGYLDEGSGDMPISNALWTSRYPRLATYLTDQVNEPKYCQLSRNIKATGIGAFTFFVGTGGSAGNLAQLNNVESLATANFANYAGLNFELIGTSTAWASALWSRIPRNQIGPPVYSTVIPFTVSDPESAAATLTMSTSSSSNPTMIPTANVAFGGAAGNRSLVAVPAANQNGSSTVVIAASDGQASGTRAFAVTVSSAEDSPTVSSIANQTIQQSQNTGALGFNVSDGETAAGSLTLDKVSSNTTLVPTANIVYGGSGTTRTVTVTPAAGLTGTAEITIIVSDAALNVASTKFTLTVSATGSGTTWYVSTTGGSSGATPGTIGSPFSLSYALGGAGSRILPGHTVEIRAGTYTGSFGSSLSGNVANRITFRAYQNETVIWDRNSTVDEASPTFLRTGSYCDFVNIRIINSAARLTDVTRGGGYYQTAGGHDRFFFCTFMDGPNGIAYQVKPSTDGGNLYYGCIAIFNGYRVGADNHGHNGYIQNGGTDPVVYDKCGFAYSGDWGTQFYSTSPDTPMKNFHPTNCVLLMNGYLMSALGASGISGGGFRFTSSIPMTGARIVGCHIYHRPTDGGRALYLGGNGIAQSDIAVLNNWTYGAERSIAVIDFDNMTVTGNEFSTLLYTTVDRSSGGSATWNNNTYRVRNDFQPGGSFAGWQSATGFDAASTFSASAPAASVTIHALNDYPAISSSWKAIVFIFNPSDAATVAVDPSSVLGASAAYRFQKLGNPFSGTSAASGTYAGSGTVTVNMNTVPVATPPGLSTPVNSAPRADAFIIMSP